MRNGIAETILITLITGVVTLGTLYFEYKNNQLIQNALFSDDNITKVK